MSDRRRIAVDDDVDGEIIEIEGHDDVFHQLQDHPTTPSNADNAKTHRYLDDTINYPDREIRWARLSNSTTVKVGDTVEMKSRASQRSRGLQSGDFLRVQHIVYNDTTQETRLRGLRLKRAKYHEQIFAWKLNELVLVLKVYDNDPRPEFVQAMEDIPIHDVLRKREVIFSPRPYVPTVGLDTYRDVFNTQGYPKHWLAMSSDELTAEVFHHCRLVCRNLHIMRHDKHGKFREGEIRLLYRKESDCRTSEATQRGHSRNAAIKLDDDEASTLTARNGHYGKPPTTACRYTAADVFCCGGGATQGMVQAGFKVTWALDKDNGPLQTYASNHPSVVVLLMDAQDFSLLEGREIQDFVNGWKTSMKVDLLHLSFPCCFWARCKTCPGPNDQANYESWTTAGAILKKAAPRVFTVEQTDFFYESGGSRRYFNLLLKDMFEAGYKVRYKVQDCSKLGVPQGRKRLLFIGARRGLPLPPFPKDTHGPPGSGLKPFVYVADALRLLERQRPHAQYDLYDDLTRKKRTDKTPYDPRTVFFKCITCGGGNNYHYSGKRNYIARELAAAQTFPGTYKFVGSPTKAIEMIGNAIPPSVEEQLALSCGQTLEAFDAGLIDAEDDLSDLRGLLESRGCVIRRAPSDPNHLFSGQPAAPLDASRQPQYRYLSRLADHDPEPRAAAPPQRQHGRAAYVDNFVDLT